MTVENVYPNDEARIVRDYRRCKEAEELGREAQQQIDRKLTWFHDEDGMLVIKARLPAEAGQMFVPILENKDGELLNVGRKTRSIPPALHRALKSRDRGCCRFPGCPNTRYLDGHHIKHWAHGGETKLSNLVSLCRFHHRQVHEGNVEVHVLDDGAIRFAAPKGKSFESTLPDHTQPLGDWHQLVDKHEGQGLRIDHHTAAARLHGDGYDHGLAIDSLLRRARGGSSRAVC